MPERRTIPRWQMDKDVRVALPGRDVPLYGKVVDMNQKGMQVALSVELPDRSPLQMGLSVGRGLEIAVEAMVPWHRRDGNQHYYGLAFSRIADDDKDRIGDYVRVNCAEQWRKHWWENA